MAKKLTDEEVTTLIHEMGDLLFIGGAKIEAETPFGQARLDTALRIILIAAAGQKPKEPPVLSVVDGGKG